MGTGLVRSLVRLSRAACGRVGRRLPHVRPDIDELYRAEVGRRLRGLEPGALAADVGGGRSCRFAHERSAGVRLVGVDISDDELRLNRDIDEWRLADCTRRMPFGDREVALIASSSAVEHFRDTAGFVAEAARVLRPGGWFVNVFPCRFAPFALLNQSLPRSVSRLALRAVFPQSEGVLGFKAYYDRCYLSGFAPLLRRNGLEIKEAAVSYSQSSYFDFFAPLYAASIGYELMVYYAGARDLAAYLLVSARRSGGS